MSPKFITPNAEMFYLKLLDQRAEKTQIVENICNIYADIKNGSGVPLNSVDYIVEAFREKLIVRMSVEFGVRLDDLSKFVANAYGEDPDGIMTEWTNSLFSLGKGVQDLPSLEMSDVEVLNSAIRYASGEDTSSGRPLINHSAGGCAAFAVILNRVLGGAGRYVLNEDMHNDSAGHVALKVGNYVCDGKGVHTADDFLRAWSHSGGLSEVADTSSNGDHIRRYGSRLPVFDEDEIENCLREKIFTTKSELTAAMPV